MIIIINPYVHRIFVFNSIWTNFSRKERAPLKKFVIFHSLTWNPTHQWHWQTLHFPGLEKSKGGSHQLPPGQHSNHKPDLFHWAPFAPAPPPSPHAPLALGMWIDSLSLHLPAKHQQYRREHKLGNAALYKKQTAKHKYLGNWKKNLLLDVLSLIL